MNELPFVNETIKELIAENKINNNFEIIEKPKNGGLFQSTNAAQTLLNDELNERWKLVDEKELRIPLIATIATLKRKNKKCGPKEVFKLSEGQTVPGLNDSHIYSVSLVRQ